VLTGGIGNDELFGLTGNDTLSGGIGNDLLDGGPGADTMRGGQGDDTYLIDNGSDVITENVNEGTDVVRSSITYTLGANVEHLTLMGTAAVNGTGNSLDNVLIGNSGNNNLAGSAGNDRLDGAAGNDTMVGGAGNDTFVVDQPGDIVTEALNQGTDTVESSVTFTLGSNVENLILTGTANINGTGSSANNMLVGNSGANQLDAGSGNDSLDGGGGNDKLQGGGGDDTVTGGMGDDLLGAGSGNDVLDGGDGVDTLDGGSGNDILDGGAGNDSLSGGSGADQISGGTGNDSLTGGSGNDLYSFSRGDGQDTINDSDSLQGNQDTLRFGTAINPFDLVISRQANDLRLAIHGAGDSLTIRNWYLTPTTNQIEVLQAGNGQHLLNTEVDQLIQAMASFGQQTGLTWDQAIDQQPQAVQTVLAASWH
jgi:Ca2+-binding RTX toxin-like protein